ncbi:MAG: ferrous iron transport protein B [Candidatus Bathyarchaeia archaeon]
MSEKIKELLGEEAEVTLAEKRYEVISKLLPRVLKGEKPLIRSDLLDKAFLNRYLGIPTFLALWWALFRFTFDVSAPLSDLIDMVFGRLREIASMSIQNEQLASFVADGLIGGLGSVLVFIPPIFFLFFGLSILEDSGYLARAAFVVDRVMYKLGLHGKSFIPMLIGFGCNIPGVMATRTIDKEEDRVLTILVNPLMSCSARLPVYVLIGSAVLGGYAAAGVYSMYVLGIVLAVVLALFFRRVIPYFKGKPSAFILELPMYAMPTLRSTLMHMWERGVLFLKKAGTIILLATVVIWALSNYPWGPVHSGPEPRIEISYIGSFGHMIEPIFRPLGFDWRAAVALFFGFVAKEVVVDTFGVLGLGGAEELRQVFTPVSGLAFMAFTLIYIPCLATIGTIYRETNSWKWTIFTVVYGLILAYLVAFLIVGIGGLLEY